MKRNRKLAVMIVIVTAIVCLALASVVGCGFGTAPVWSTANPTKEVEIGYDPLSGTYRAKYRDNAGGWMKAKEMLAKTGDKEFHAKGLELGDESVKNRDANVDQMKAGAEMTTAAFKGATELAMSIGKAFAFSTESVRKPPEVMAVAEYSKLAILVLLIVAGGIVAILVWKKIK